MKKSVTPGYPVASNPPSALGWAIRDPIGLVKMVVHYSTIGGGDVFLRDGWISCLSGVCFVARYIEIEVHATVEVGVLRSQHTVTDLGFDKVSMDMVIKPK